MAYSNANFSSPYLDAFAQSSWKPPTGTGGNASRHAAALDKARAYSSSQLSGVANMSSNVLGQMGQIGSMAMSREADQKSHEMQIAAYKEAQKAEKRKAGGGFLGNLLGTVAGALPIPGAGLVGGFIKSVV